MAKMDSVRIWVLHPHALRIGDEIVVTDDKAKTYCRTRGGVQESDATGLWGLQATVAGYALEHVGRWQGREKRKKPGFYHSPYFPQLRFPDEVRRFSLFGEELYIHFSGVMAADQKEYRRRLDELDQDFERYDHIGPAEFVCALPDTPFWEGDRVRVRDGAVVGKRHLPEGGTAMVAGMDFRLDLMRPLSVPPPEEKPFCYLSDPKQVPRYVLADRFRVNGWSYWKADELELVERGNFWKQECGEPLVFAGLDEEAFFFCESGACARVAQAAERDLAAAIERLKETDGHGLRYEDEFTGWSSDQWWDIIRFDDEDLGRRVREATLNDGFVIPTDAWIKKRENECKTIAAREAASE